MKISDFIRANRDTIIADWEAFADALTPGRDLSPEELCDYATGVLDSIIDSMEAGDDELDAAATPDLKQKAKKHADDRFLQKFTLSQVAAEYRGLRDSVTRRWLPALQSVGSAELEELTQFNKAVDLSLAVSVEWYDRKLRAAQEELRAADRAKNEFLAILGHELRNPLAPIGAGLELLKRVPSRQDIISSLQPMMERQFTHLTRLVDDLLDIARISQGTIHLDPAPLDFNAVVQAALEQVMPLIRERQHRLEVGLAQEPLTVVGDFDRLTQVVANLLSNACKYSEPGGRIAVSSTTEDGETFLRVRDGGHGIPAEHLSSIFELFRQVPEHRVATGGGGLGVGLALSQRLMQMHGGAIEAESAGLGHGSMFLLRLPLRLPESRSGDAADAAEDAVAPRRVLVVDDNVDAAWSLQKLVETMGHQSRVAHNGPAALEQVEAFAPEVVLLDLGMPGMNGVEVARLIRSRPDGRRIVLVAVTGWTPGSHDAGEAGFDARLTKPARWNELRDCLAIERQLAN